MIDVKILFGKNPLRTVGLMSGTSMDGLDICLAENKFENEGLSYRILGMKTVPFPEELKNKIRTALTGTVKQIGPFHYELGEYFADETARFIQESGVTQIDAVGMHGQTIFHQNKKATLQIGEPSFLVKELCIPVVSDFRARDISEGGTGAPLIPIVDKWLFQNESEGIICLNLGGIANITCLPPKSYGEEIMGFDTGPGMALLDEVFRQNGDDPFDENGEMALRGTPDLTLVDSWIKDEFITSSPPKSTGRDCYGKSWIKNHAGELEKIPLEDQLASLSFFTAKSIYVNCASILGTHNVKSIIASGGGIHHSAVLKYLNRQFNPVPVKSIAEYGIDPDLKEAFGFSLLAAAYFNGIPANISSVTGADKEVILGKLTI
tara:strand:+ start:8346 stop:9479 length:1134 start_codon:yes stop_codon:yes gene_type:complete